MRNILESIGCIAQSCDLVPTMLYIDCYDDASVALKPVAGRYDRPLWFPRDMIYKYDLALLKNLRRAHELGDKSLLRKLWGDAEPWVPDQERT